MRDRLPRMQEGDVGNSQSLLGECLRRSGDLVASEGHLRRGLERLTTAYPATDPRVRDAKLRLRDWCVAAGRVEEAEAIRIELDAGGAPSRP